MKRLSFLEEKQIEGIVRNPGTVAINFLEWSPHQEQISRGVLYCSPDKEWVYLNRESIVPEVSLIGGNEAMGIIDEYRRRLIVKRHSGHDGGYLLGLLKKFNEKRLQRINHVLKHVAT